MDVAAIMLICSVVIVSTACRCQPLTRPGTRLLAKARVSNGLHVKPNQEPDALCSKTAWNTHTHTHSHSAMTPLHEDKFLVV